jgi:hypothetical protein
MFCIFNFVKPYPPRVGAEAGLCNKKQYGNSVLMRLLFRNGDFATAVVIPKDVPNVPDGTAWIVCYYAYRQVVPDGTLLACELFVKNYLHPTSYGIFWRRTTRIVPIGTIFP